MQGSFHARKRAFTLVEVVLAILIICGIMTVLLYFYQRAAEVRSSALEETEFVSVGRLLMEQITTELRSARVVEDQFFAMDGSSNSIRFVCTTLPAVTRWLVDTNEPLRGGGTTDLKEVYYGLLIGTNVSDVLGVERREKFLLPAGTSFDTNVVEDTNAPALFSGAELTPTNTIAQTNSPGGLAQPLTAKIKFVQFRYWDGTEWVETWGGMDLPSGVEISIGREAMPANGEQEGYPYEFFRRVVFLPHGKHPANTMSEGLGEEELAL